MGAAQGAVDGPGGEVHGNTTTRDGPGGQSIAIVSCRRRSWGGHIQQGGTVCSSTKGPPGLSTAANICRRQSPRTVYSKKNGRGLSGETHLRGDQLSYDSSISQLWRDNWSKCILIIIIIWDFTAQQYEWEVRNANKRINYERAGWGITNKDWM